jgi:hypothetical protein
VIEVNQNPTIVSFSALAQTVRHETTICHDPACRHNTPIQEMYAVPYQGHTISVTQDGHEYNVMIDYDPKTIRTRLTKVQLNEYVERMVNQTYSLPH